MTPTQSPTFQTPCEYFLPPETVVNASEVLETIRSAGPSETFKLPKAIEERGGEFVCLVFLQAKKGRGNEMLKYIKAVHQETDEVEMEVYSHRAMRGREEEDEDCFCIVIEYDTPAAFVRHYKGDALRAFYSSDFLELPPKLSFCYDVETV